MADVDVYDLLVPVVRLPFTVVPILPGPVDIHLDVRTVVIYRAYIMMFFHMKSRTAGIIFSLINLP